MNTASTYADIEKKLFIIGAGASHDIKDQSSPFRGVMPLGSDLINKIKSFKSKIYYELVFLVLLKFSVEMSGQTNLSGSTNPTGMLPPDMYKLIDEYSEKNVDFRHIGKTAQNVENFLKKVVNSSNFDHDQKLGLYYKNSMISESCKFLFGDKDKLGWYSNSLLITAACYGYGQGYEFIHGYKEYILKGRNALQKVIDFNKMLNQLKYGMINAKL